MNKFIVYDDELGHRVNVDNIDLLISVDIPNSEAKTSIRVGKTVVHSLLTVEQLVERIYTTPADE